MNPVERNIEKISKIVFTKSGFNLFWGAATLSAELDCKSEKENPNDKTSKNSHHLEEKNHNQNHDQNNQNNDNNQNHNHNNNQNHNQEPIVRKP